MEAKRLAIVRVWEAQKRVDPKMVDVEYMQRTVLPALLKLAEPVDGIGAEELEWIEVKIPAYSLATGPLLGDQPLAGHLWYALSRREAGRLHISEFFDDIDNISREKQPIGFRQLWRGVFRLLEPIAEERTRFVEKLMDEMTVAFPGKDVSIGHTNSRNGSTRFIATLPMELNFKEQLLDVQYKITTLFGKENTFIVSDDVDELMTNLLWPPRNDTRGYFRLPGGGMINVSLQGSALVSDDGRVLAEFETPLNIKRTVIGDKDDVGTVRLVYMYELVAPKVTIASIPNGSSLIREILMNDIGTAKTGIPMHASTKWLRYYAIPSDAYTQIQANAKLPHPVAPDAWYPRLPPPDEVLIIRWLDQPSKETKDAARPAIKRAKDGMNLEALALVLADYRRNVIIPIYREYVLTHHPELSGTDIDGNPDLLYAMLPPKPTSGQNMTRMQRAQIAEELIQSTMASRSMAPYAWPRPLPAFARPCLHLAAAAAAALEATHIYLPAPHEPDAHIAHLLCRDCALNYARERAQ